MFKGFFDRFKKKEEEIKDELVETIEDGQEDLVELEEEIKEDLQEAREELDQDRQDLEEKIEQAKDQGELAKEKLEDQVKEQVETLKDQGEEVKEELGQKAEELKEEVLEKGQEIDEELADKLEEKLEEPEEKLEEKPEEKKEQGEEEKSDSDQEELEEKEEKGIFNRFLKGLSKTRNQLSNQIDAVLADFRTVDAEMMEELENVLIASDLGVETTMKVVDTLDQNLRLKNIKDAGEAKKELANILKEMIHAQGLDHSFDFESPTVLLVVGVNGVGKTTSIGKMAHRLKRRGKSVTLVAADTFRAAAIEQLEEWAKRADVPIIAHQEGADPASVIYDGIASARSKKTDVLICDTAGRLHNKKNLMAELEKINRIIDREFPEAKKEVYIVVDGTTGQNALHQAREFKKATDVTGAVITKLDGTAKGGILIPLEVEENIPVKLIGIGEQVDDLVDFKVDEFIDAIVN